MTGRMRTLRGTVSANSQKQLITADGNLTVGYTVRRFYAWPTVATVSSDWHAILSLDYDATATMSAGDNRQIGWMWEGGATAGAYNFEAAGILDPDHIIIEDLHILNTSAPGIELNYLVILEERILTESQAVVSLIKTRSQDDSR